MSLGHIQKGCRRLRSPPPPCASGSRAVSVEEPLGERRRSQPSGAGPSHKTRPVMIPAEVPDAGHHALRSKTTVRRSARNCRASLSEIGDRQRREGAAAVPQSEGAENGPRRSEACQSFCTQLPGFAGRGASWAAEPPIADGLGVPRTVMPVACPLVMTKPTPAGTWTRRASHDRIQVSVVVNGECFLLEHLESMGTPG